MKNMVGLLTLAAALSLASGCSKSATGQVVAVVNGEEISQQELNAAIQGLNLPPTADKKIVQAQTLQRLIDRKVLVQKAEKEGLDRTPEFLLQTRRTHDDLLIALLSNKAGKGVSVPDSGSISKFMQTHPTLFGGRTRYAIDQIAFQAAPDAPILKKLEPIHDWATMNQVLGASGLELRRAQATLDSATIPPEMAEKIAALPPGEPFIVPVNGGFIVNLIRASQPVPTDETQAKPAAAELVRRQQIESVMQTQLKSAREAAKIEYQAGFGPPPAAKAPGAAPTAK